MPATLYLLDTNVISELMRQPQGPLAARYRARLLDPAPCQMVTSIVVQCELLYGLSKRPSPRLQRAYDLQLAQLPVVALDSEAAQHYAQLRCSLEQQGLPIGPNDTLIAAHALALGAILVTADAEFVRVPGLALENWLD